MHFVERKYQVYRTNTYVSEAVHIDFSIFILFPVSRFKIQFTKDNQHNRIQEKLSNRKETETNFKKITISISHRNALIHLFELIDSKFVFLSAFYIRPAVHLLHLRLTVSQVTRNRNGTFPERSSRGVSI